MAQLTKDSLNEILTQIFETADAASNTKEEMRAALDGISDLADPDVPVVRGEDGVWRVDAGDEDEDADADADEGEYDDE